MTEARRVYLVGAGPGDPGLITVKGRDCLARADVVIYDSLANPVLLALAPANAERLYVGKRAGHHSMKQDEINELLVAKGRAGGIIVRLKGGDPFVFGRGGEEALALRAAGIPFEVVPGVTAAVAAAAYAGIPVTHRTCNSTLSLVTGHEAPDKSESAIDWAALATGGGTLAFYMGVRNLPRIAEQLMRHGRGPDTPVALIRYGTLPRQEVVTGTLATIVDEVAAAGLKPPALILVGEVVDLRQSLNWFEALPLFGRTVVVTRSRTQASDLAATLAQLGAEVLLQPTISIAPAADPGPLRQVAGRLHDFDWILFTSVNAVDAVVAAVAEHGSDARAFAGCHLAAIGPGTATALEAHGLRPDLMPPRFTSVSLFETLRGTTSLAGQRVLLPRADIAPPWLPEQLREAGAVVTEATAYRTLPGEADPQVLDALRSGRADAVTFTSSSTARNFAELARRALGELPQTTYVSIGPETSRTAAAEGMTVAAEAELHSIPGLVDTLIRTLSQAAAPARQPLRPTPADS